MTTDRIKQIQERLEEIECLLEAGYSAEFETNLFIEMKYLQDELALLETESSKNNS